MGGIQRHRSVAAIAALALAASLAACGGSDSSGSEEETAGNYSAKVVAAEFPTRQRLGQTSLLRIGVRNTGAETIPALTVTITGGGELERNSALPFGYRDPSPEIAQPDRPVWALAANYPRVEGASARAGAETSNAKTFDFGPLAPGRRLNVEWKVIAVKTGRYELLYGIDDTKAGGSFTVRISKRTPNVVVKDNGEVVEAPRDATEANR